MDQQCGIHKAEIENLKKVEEQQWSAISHLRSRLDELMRKWIPVWVAVVLMAMSGVTASALTALGMALKTK
jgi:hypothetical protein